MHTSKPLVYKPFSQVSPQNQSLHNIKQILPLLNEYIRLGRQTKQPTKGKVQSVSAGLVTTAGCTTTSVKPLMKGQPFKLT